jgi:hypothetical protein
MPWSFACHGEGHQPPAPKKKIKDFAGLRTEIRPAAHGLLTAIGKETFGDIDFRA